MTRSLGPDGYAATPGVMQGAYMGHGLRTGGLQLHSVGGIYPFVSVVVVTAFSTDNEMLPRYEHRWVLLDTSTGHQIENIESREQLDELVAFMREPRNGHTRIRRDMKLIPNGDVVTGMYMFEVKGSDRTAFWFINKGA